VANVLIISLNISTTKIKAQKCRIFYHEVLSRAKKKLIFEKLRFLTKILRIEKQLYLTIFFMEFYQLMF